MNRETLNAISRRIREEHNNEEPSGRRMDGSEYPQYDEHRISARYNGSTNTYRAEGVVEGRIEHSKHGEGSQHRERKIGFGGSENEDLVYKMEESFEKEIDDIVYYSELALEAERKGHSEFAEGFYEVAKEKLKCAECIRMRLIKHGSYDPATQTELEEMFDRAKHTFRRL